MIISFFLFLSLAEWISAKIIRAGIIGHIAVGIIYGKPLADILKLEWQETFIALGYVGLILIIFEGTPTYASFHGLLLDLDGQLIDNLPGGLGARIDLLKQNFSLSMIGAATGVLFPIGLSYLLLYLGFGYGPVETFIIGAALSATSLGMSSDEHDFSTKPHRNYVRRYIVRLSNRRSRPDSRRVSSRQRRCHRRCRRACDVEVCSLPPQPLLLY